MEKRSENHEVRQSHHQAILSLCELQSMLFLNLRWYGLLYVQAGRVNVPLLIAALHSMLLTAMSMADNWDIMARFK